VTTEGEAWTREQLERLLGARFRPAAVTGFLVASQGRAGQVRRARPELARREAAWAATGAVAWIALAAGRIEPFRTRLRAGLAGWGLTVLMLDWHLGMLETPDGRPRNLGLADAATLLRAWLVPAVADRPSPGLCAIGFATDVLDGRLARASEPTRLGRDLEGLVDVAFSTAALAGARRRDWLGRSAVAAEVLRLGAGSAYALVTYFARAHPPDARMLRAARALAPLRATGVVLAGTGRRRSADALLLTGSLASMTVIAQAARSVHLRSGRLTGPLAHPAGRRSARTGTSTLPASAISR
jgi:phosphatidylglycerophosphate synthase